MLPLLVSASLVNLFAAGYAQEMLPVLDHGPGQSEAVDSSPSITPLTELMGLPLTEATGQTTLPGPVALTPHDKLKPLLGQTKMSDPAEKADKNTELVPLITQPQMIAEPSLETQPAESKLKPVVQSQPVIQPVVQSVNHSSSVNQIDEPQLKSKAIEPSTQTVTTANPSVEPKSERKAKSEKKKAQKANQNPVQPVQNASNNEEAQTQNINTKGTNGMGDKVAPDQAVLKPERKPFRFNPDVGQAIQNAKGMLTGAEPGIKPVSYSPLPGIAVFAVLKHGNERIFGDLPVMFAREYAQRLGAKLPQTKIYNPIYTVDELRMQGLGHIYDQIMNYYIKTGAPEPTATDYLLKQISTNRPTISRLVFVEADVDFNHPDASTGLWDRTKLILTDDMPKQAKTFVVSHIQIFDAEKPDFPIVWSGNWQRSIKQDQFFNVTPSVYADSDSQQAFARVSRQMSEEMIYVTPKAAYMLPNVKTDIEGQLVSGKQATTSSLLDSQIVPKGLSHENKQAIERILQRQSNPGSQ